MQIIWYDTVDSTNTVALKKAAGLEDCAVIAARRQTAGRGQRGNTWTSEPGENLTFSVFLRWPSGFAAGDVIRMNWLAAVAVRDFLQEEGVPAVIKWPNDIYVGKKKICGILVENRLSERFSVIGIGINLNQTDFPASLPNPTSLRLLTGRRSEAEEALERFMTHFVQIAEDLVLPNGTKQTQDSLFSAYGYSLFQKDIPSPYRDLRSGELFTGIIRGVSPTDGRLLMERSASHVLYGFKDIGYII